MSARTWALEVLVSAVIMTLIFGVLIGQRGLTLIVFVAVISLLIPSIIWLRARGLNRTPK